MTEPDTHGLPVVYANWFRMFAAPYDLTLDLGYRAANVDPEAEVRLVLSWEHAVAIRDAITHAVDNYEKATGEPVRTLGGPSFREAQFVPDH